MRPRHLLTTAVATLGVAASLPAVLATPAQAGIPGLARGNVVFSSVLSGTTEIAVKACASGSADDLPFIAGEFAVALVAVRSNGSQFIDPHVFGGPSFAHCHIITFDSQPYGSVDVAVTYGGAGLDVVTLAWGVAAWSPQTNGSTWTSFGV